MPRLAIALGIAALAASPAAAQRSGSAGSVPRIQGQRPAPPVDWARHVERTAEGGWRMGNPDAALKLVEYGSVTCSHCASFAAAADQSLRSRVRTGRLSFELIQIILYLSSVTKRFLVSNSGPNANSLRPFNPEAL